MPKLEGYPTPEQVEEMFNAYKKDGEAGIKTILRKRAAEGAARRTEFERLYSPRFLAKLKEIGVELRKKRAAEKMNNPTSKPETTPEKKLPITEHPSD